MRGLDRPPRRCAESAVRFAVKTLAPALARVVGFMARTGIGTDACLRWGSLPMPVDFYSPVPDLADLERREVWDRRSDLVGIDFRPEAQVAFLRALGHEFGRECDWPPHATGDAYQFHTENGSFSYACAASTHCIMRHFKPLQVIEIGSGHSSLVIAAALLSNASDSAKGAEYTLTDPYPWPIVEHGLLHVTRVIKQRVELVDVHFFERLSENDVLFIDSGHTVRMGGDVNYLMLDVLPRLARGVIVHFHDIPLPGEYPKVYAINPRFRVFWTEAYLLQAFLCFNSQFEVLLAMAYLTADWSEELLAAFPCYDPAKHLATSGSFWIRRK